MKTLLVLGGYGFFGQRIAATLAGDAGLRVLIAGRDRDKALQVARRIGLADDQAVRVDAADPALPDSLRALGVDVLVHTAGPFQGQDYTVARAAITAGCHYLDLADGRAFVAGIESLDGQAQARGVSVISGASSVPALSSAVVDRYAPGFARLDSIRMGIASGARAPGLATVKGIFSYCGRPIRRLQDGAWVWTHGWLDLQRHRFPDPVGVRWLGSCDIPDLEVFAHRYPQARTVTFHAGFASTIGHLAVWALAGLVKARVLDSMAAFAAPLSRISRWIEPVVSDKGGMFVELAGLGPDGNALTRCWHLVAAQNHGPFVPCGAAVALVRKIVAGQPLAIGARACAGLLTVDEYLAPLSNLDIQEVPP
nr:saccharopine dehydrogenase NADP-binding domain-containing protein [Panacagrimonas sp.]